MFGHSAISPFLGGTRIYIYIYIRVIMEGLFRGNAIHKTLSRRNVESDNIFFEEGLYIYIYTCNKGIFALQESDSRNTISKRR